MSKQTITLPKQVVDQLTADAKEVFARHPDCKVLYATINGGLYFEKEKNSAADAARKLKQEELIVIERGEELPIVAESEEAEAPSIVGKYDSQSDDELLQLLIERKEAGRNIDVDAAKTREDYIAALTADDSAE